MTADDITWAQQVLAEDGAERHRERARQEMAQKFSDVRDQPIFSASLDT